MSQIMETYSGKISFSQKGELLGLRWDDVNLEQGILNVRFSLKRLPSGVLALKQPKTKTSIRAIKLGRQTIDILQLQKIRNTLNLVNTRTGESIWFDAHQAHLSRMRRRVHAWSYSRSVGQQKRTDAKCKRGTAI